MSPSKAPIRHTHTLQYIPSVVNVVRPQRCFVISFHLQPPSFFFVSVTGKCRTPVTKTISYCGNHFKVVYAISHHSKLECAPQCTHRSSYAEPAERKRSALVPEATVEAFKEVSSVGFVVRTVRRSKCWKVFSVGARSECTVLHPHSLKDEHYSV